MHAEFRAMQTISVKYSKEVFTTQHKLKHVKKQLQIKLSVYANKPTYCSQGKMTKL